MNLSYGISKLVQNNTIYNLGIALPFICAFYLFNSSGSLSISVPFLDIVLSSEISCFVTIFLITIYYILFVALLFLFSGLSVVDEMQESLFCSKLFCWVIIGVFVLSQITHHGNKFMASNFFRFNSYYLFADNILEVAFALCFVACFFLLCYFFLCSQFCYWHNVDC